MYGKVMSQRCYSADRVFKDFETVSNVWREHGSVLPLCRFRRMCDECRMGHGHKLRVCAGVKSP